MPYLGRLIHTMAVKRAVTVVDAVQHRTLGPYTVVEGLESVACLLLDSQEAIQRAFGRDLQADGLVHLPGNIDLRPGVTATDGKSDQLVITDELDNTTTWYVIKNRAMAGYGRRMGLVAVRRMGA